MKNFFKIFSIFFICLFLAFLLGSRTYVKFNKVEEEQIQDDNMKLIRFGIGEGKGTDESNEDTKKINNIVNFVVLGMEGMRSDVILFISLDKSNHKINLISIPRDTYIYRKGYESAEQRKINAVYGAHGIKGVKEAVKYILNGVNINHYIMLDYNGVEKIVDSVGGVEVNVPFHMKYYDPTSKPPLYINIPKGNQVLNGKDAVGFLRYRKSNNNKIGYKEGDLGRIKAQHEFLKSFVNKALGFRLPFVIKSCFEYIDTDMKVTEVLMYAKDIMEVEEKNFSFLTLPGKSEFRTIKGKKLSYYICNKVDTEKIIINLYTK